MSISQTDEQKAAEIERLAGERVARFLEYDAPDVMAHAVERALRRVMMDAEIRAAFWKAGYDEFEKHAGNSIAQLIGKKVIHILVAATFAAAITWVVVTGRFK